jgi:energy-coupling factor transport system permease protein
MSDFEYLSNISMGQYLPLKSFLHQRDPRAKLAGITLIVLSLTISSSIAGVGLGLIAILALLIISRVPAKHTLNGLMKPLPFLLILAALQLFITPHSEDALPVFQLLGIQIFASGIKAAGLLLMKFSGLITLFSISSASISTLELIHGLDLLFKPLTKFGIRTQSMAMTLQITFRFIPFLAISAERIAKSQASRGAEWGNGRMRLVKRVRQVIPLLIPLFNSSLRQAETLADAMLARGFENTTPRSGLREYRFTWLDAAFLAGCGICAYLMLFVK